MWSFYFVILDFLNETLPWRTCKDTKSDDVRESKSRCLNCPELHLWKTTANMQEVKDIFWAIKKLRYADRPDYQFIRQKLVALLKNEKCGKDAKPYASISVYLLFNNNRDADAMFHMHWKRRRGEFQRRRQKKIAVHLLLSRWRGQISNA
eukprot:TRINITY_DN1333_c0_g1_i5.p1 TRINITY_DN1333_c0_g1~~TRINITY_DN1333_c0_g1_i5.p1  ORF type:complete len:150 (+),score=29.04 TRINITY_DN1333_c0_g1_i5:929-1378(+)